MPHNWLRGEDSNLRPLGYEPNELPTAPPRDIDLYIIQLFCSICQHFLKKFYISLNNGIIQ